MHIPYFSTLSNPLHNNFWLKWSFKNCGNDFNYVTFIVCCDGINDDNSVELKGSCLGDKIQPDLVTVYTPNGDTLDGRNVYENEDQTLFLYYVASIEVIGLIALYLFDTTVSEPVSQQQFNPKVLDKHT